MNAIADETDGVVTATLAPTSLSSLSSLSTDPTDIITITVNDDNNATLDANHVQQLNNKTKGVITITNDVHIVGDTNEFISFFVEQQIQQIILHVDENGVQAQIQYNKVDATTASFEIQDTPTISQLNHCCTNNRRGYGYTCCCFFKQSRRINNYIHR